MTDILSVRQSMRASKANLDAQQATLAKLEDELGGNELPPSAQARLRQQIAAQNAVVRAAQKNFDAWTATYQAAVLADPIHAADAGLPLVLLPVRIETAYLQTAAGMDLVVRVYPDDIHVDTHEPELTAGELVAGTAYWQAVWGAGPNEARLNAAWSSTLAQLKPERAAWAIRALTPAVARPVIETPVDQPQPQPPLAAAGSRPGTFNRPARTALLPDYWRVIGLKADNTELFYAEGSPIPATLDLSFGPPSLGAPDSDLPFHEGSRWLVDLDAAIAAGMAIRIPLTGTAVAAPDYSIPQLFVLGANAAVLSADAAAHLESALIAHQYTNGLGFLPPGTPTNNTAQTRSAWQSAPQVPSPDDLEATRAGYQPSSQQNAAAAATALGIDGSQALCAAPNGLTDQQSDIAAVQQFLWPALAGKALLWFYTTWTIPQGEFELSDGGWSAFVNTTLAQSLQAHAAGWVRSRGSLPVMRVGNQPYGLLPALSLDGWVVPADDPTTTLLTWLRTLRSYWSASVGNCPRVLPTSDPNADGTVVNILNRLPVSVDILVRPETDPVYDGVPVSSKPGSDPSDLLPYARIPGQDTFSEMFLAVPSSGTPPRIPVDVVHDKAADQALLLTYQRMFHDVLSVLQQNMTKDEFTATWGDMGGINFPVADLFLSLVQDSFVDPLEQNANLADSMVSFAMFFDPRDPVQLARAQQMLPAAQALVTQFDALCVVNPDSYEAAIRETLDVFSHRLDAWIASLAARRLDEMRAARPSGLVLGAFGWVENLSLQSGSDQIYIHAPSMNHAATAAVLRAGYDSHGASGPLAVNLVSSRVRKADWLAAGVRSGQTLGALLGYRFERGLHEANLDGLIAGLRTQHPLPLPAGPDADANGQSALEAIAARNVVDGRYLSENKASVLQELGLDQNPASQTAVTVSALLDDLADVVDALGDLLLAESVHHLVSGNPLRAGLAADTAGRGDPVPDRFDVTLTPRTSRPLTWQLGALLPAVYVSSATGWQTTTRPRAAAEPHVDAWVAGMLGNAGSWHIACTVSTAAGDSASAITLDTLNLCALDVITEASGSPCQLELRIAESVSGGLPEGTSVSVSRAPNPDGTPGFGELLSLAGRIRTVLGKATALGPQQLQGAGTSSVVGLNVAELDARAQDLGLSLSNAVQTLQNAVQGLDAAAGADDATLLAALKALRSALIALADHGVPAAWPMGGADSSATNVSALSAQGASLLAATQALAGQVCPVAPGADAASTDVTQWLAAVTEYMRGIVGTGIPIIAVYSLTADSQYAAAFAAGAAPSGADPTAVMVWLRRIARIRTNSAALHDLLLAAESLQASPASVKVAQLPAVPGAAWAGLPFIGKAPPTARLALVFSTPAPIDPAASFCGFVCDSWTEQLPGVTSVAGSATGYEAAEITGMAFKADTPSAAAPQAVLLAVAPDPAQGWSIDVLLDTVRETLDLAKIRPVDTGDLVRFFRVLPAIHSSSNVDQLLAAANSAPATGGHN